MPKPPLFALTLLACAATAAIAANPIRGALKIGDAGSPNTVEIASPEGWGCIGKFEAAKQPVGHARVVPLACNDGATGEIALSPGQAPGEVEGDFKLSDGRNGVVIFAVE